MGNEGFGVSRGALTVHYVDNAVFSSANERGVLVYVEVAAAHTRCEKQNATCNGRATYLYMPSALQEMKSMHSIARKKITLSFDDFLFTGSSRLETVSLREEKRLLIQ